MDANTKLFLALTKMLVVQGMLRETAGHKNLKKKLDEACKLVLEVLKTWNRPEEVSAKVVQRAIVEMSQDFLDESWIDDIPF